jgi:hypothetical protein
MSNVAEKLAKKSSRPAQTKQVRLRLVYVDFWSILKLSFLWSIIDYRRPVGSWHKTRTDASTDQK